MRSSFASSLPSVSDHSQVFLPAKSDFFSSTGEPSNSSPSPFLTWMNSLSGRSSGLSPSQIFSPFTLSGSSSSSGSKSILTLMTFVMSRQSSRRVSGPKFRISSIVSDSAFSLAAPDSLERSRRSFGSVMPPKVRIALVGMLK